MPEDPMVNFCGVYDPAPSFIPHQNFFFNKVEGRD